MKRTAVFFDRDGTIIENRGYLADPDEVRLLPGAADTIRTINQAGHLVVIVSNQSGVARGYFDENTLTAVHQRVEELLRQEGARLDGAYYCPYLNGSEAVVEAYRSQSDLRKPEPGMLLRAARELSIDLHHSWMIGDSEKDVEAGRRAGCRTILIRGNGSTEEKINCKPTHVVPRLSDATELLCEGLARPKPTEFPPQKKESSPATPASPAGAKPPDAHSEKTLDDAPRGFSPQRGENDRIAQTLENIQDQLTRILREQRQEDFSVLRLFGALLQMIAVVVVLWGLLALLDDRNAAATARVLLACFFEIASLGAFVIDRFR